MRASSRNMPMNCFFSDEVRQDALDGDDLLEALEAGALGAEHLGHAAGGDALDDAVRCCCCAIRAPSRPRVWFSRSDGSRDARLVTTCRDFGSAKCARAPPKTRDSGVARSRGALVLRSRSPPGAVAQLGER